MDNLSSHQNGFLHPLSPLNIPPYGQAAHAPHIHRVATSSNWSNHFYSLPVNFGRPKTFNETAHLLATQSNHMRPTHQLEPSSTFQRLQPFQKPGFNRQIFKCDTTYKFPSQTRTDKAHINGHTILPPILHHQTLVDTMVNRRANAAPRPFNLGQSNSPSSNISLPPPQPSIHTVPQATDNVKNVFMARLRDLFPDICDKTLGQIYANHEFKIHDESSLLVAVQESIDDILARPFYPKRQAKRKRPEDDGSTMQDLKRPRTDPYYSRFALTLLANEFPFVQHSTIRTLLSRHKTLLDSYEAVYHLEQPGPNDGRRSPLRRLRRARPTHEIVIPDGIQREFERIKKTVSEKEAVNKKAEAERALEERYRQVGNLVECQCCFADVTPNVAIPCDGYESHLFCHQCIKKHAETQVAQMNYYINCIDVSGCQAGFERDLLQQVVGENFLKRLGFLHQMDELTRSGIEGLEGCSFCEFKAVCLPLEQDKEFRCQNPDCGRVSCRLCRDETHTPKSCEEARKERGVPERRQVEEAMTNALLRTCPKCGVSIVKGDGCNKIRCRCGTLICDVCKADITKTAYKHFTPHGCPTYELDHGQARLVGEVQEARKAAVDKIVAENGNIHRDQLHVEAPKPPPEMHIYPLEAAHQNRPPQLGPIAPQPMNMHFPPPPMLPWFAAPLRPYRVPQMNPPNQFS
ncbi:TRIAD3 [Talaromyces islandicus]|uniref:TRIAD3 n=1 Tax=Talaromyces islandicus TaxID=28573 RepID=A0A0U1LNN6_TALIS|nr:TRIAD3 [Talaromyces islandicus]